MTSRSCYTLGLVILLCLGFALTSSAQEKPVSDVCLGCICEAVSGCNLTQGCHGNVCGPFHITRPYWNDGGRLTVGNDSPQSEIAYKNCANDPHCAANTMQNYMSKFGQDCNDDNTVDCYDYAAIHTLGGFGCRGEVNYQFQLVLSNCLKAFA